jgi:hypothetical protein
MNTAITPAITARANVKKIGSKVATPTRVAGRVPLKITTPNSPLIHPLNPLSMFISAFCVSEDRHLASNGFGKTVTTGYNL